MGKKAKVSDNIAQKLQLAVRSGKFKVGKYTSHSLREGNPFAWVFNVHKFLRYLSIGYKLAKRTLRNGASKLIIISNNCPPIRKTELEYLAILGGSKVIHFEGNNVELGTACQRLHRVCVMTIQDAGDSDILASV